ncbi:MAG: hypothetical protein N5P05_002961 [Chroococcopsis gigantea SAG 12.99]|jgi:DNA sulfur modification protein DndD|nr:AAA family ATPase [Chlorogloea purpurea SAG 13.99]MDV3001355.1 hypothetical protein [Chroococcopsis gigantea SAG 12.99]
MKLLSIRLCNFRQFYGKTPEIQLARGTYNTTVIHGNNGAGKTTILNGFTWVLYDKFTAAFASPQLLVNKRAIYEVKTGASVECWVEVVFEHDNLRYGVKRKCFACLDINGVVQYSQSQLFMLIGKEDGNWYHPLQQPEEIINQILPESLHHYFFFDGEHIEHIGRHSSNSSIAEDTKDLLGVKVLDRSIEHLKKAKKTLQDEIKELGDSDLKQLVTLQNKLEGDLQRVKEKEREIIGQIEEQEELKKLLTGKLLELRGAEDLKQLKMGLDNREKTLRLNLLEAKGNLKKHISGMGYLVFLPRVSDKLYTLVNDLRSRAQLPTGIKQEFILELLQRKRCICGNELEASGAAYEQVQGWISKSGIAEVEEAIIRLESQVMVLDKQVDEFWRQVDSLQSNVQKWRGELSRVENDLDNIRAKFREYPDEDIQGIQGQLDEIEERLKEGRLEQGGYKHHYDIKSKELEALNKQIERQKIKEEKQHLAQRRILAAQEAIERLIEVKRRLENQFRQSLESKVGEIFGQISFTPYIPRLGAEYQLRLVENTSGKASPVAASTGENQILSLSFIGAMIDRVREWRQKNNFVGVDSSTFPIVMDSPFGSLDEIYRRRVARSIPRLANQLVILVTKTQWRKEVEEEMNSYIGKIYVLSYYSSKTHCEEDSIVIDGQVYPLVRKSPNNFEYTEIVEVERF